MTLSKSLPLNKIYDKVIRVEKRTVFGIVLDEDISRKDDLRNLENKTLQILDCVVQPHLLPIDYIFTYISIYI